MTPEDEMVLFDILQAIADELRRIEYEEQEVRKSESPDAQANRNGQ